MPENQESFVLDPDVLDSLTPETRAWAEALLDEFAIGLEEQRLLLAAGQCWDAAQRAMAVLAKEGDTFIDFRGSPKERPEVRIAARAMDSYARYVKQLRFPTPPALPDPPRSFPGGGR